MATDWVRKARRYVPEPAPLKIKEAWKRDKQEVGCCHALWRLVGIGKGRTGPGYNSWRESRKDQGQHPLICVAGLASGSLQHDTHCCSCCGPCCHVHTKVSYCSITALSTNPIGTLKSLKLEAVRGQRKDGTEVWTSRSVDRSTKPVVGTSGIRTLNPGEHVPVSVWDGFIDDLEEKFNCHAFNYDWRRWGDIVYAEELVDKFKIDVEKAIESTSDGGGDKASQHRVPYMGHSFRGKATVVGHSMGAPVILYVLSKLGKTWTKGHIERVILVAPAHTGSPSMIPSFAHAPFLAEEAKFIPTHLGEHTLGDLAATWVCMLAEMPTAVGGVQAYAPDFVLAKTPTKKYTLSQMGTFLEDLHKQATGRDFGPKFWPGAQEITKDMKAPWAPILIIYNAGFQTPSSYEYNTEDLDAPAKCVFKEKGDGTITSGSICAVAEAWKKEGRDVQLVEIPGRIDHKSLIVADATIAVVERAILGGDLTPIQVTIVSASDLINADCFSKSDPYCSCILKRGDKEMRGSEQKTKTIKDDLNPKWGETFTIYSYSDGDELVFSVFDDDELHDDLLGRATLTSYQLQSGYEGTLNLAMKRRKPQGTLTVKVSAPQRVQKSGGWLSHFMPR